MPSRLPRPRRPGQVWLLRAPGGNGRGGFDGLPAWHGWNATQLPLPDELRIVGRQLRALHRDVSQRARGGRKSSSLPRCRGKACLQDAPGRVEGLLLLDLRQDVDQAVPPTVALRSILAQPTQGPSSAASEALMTM